MAILSDIIEQFIKKLIEDTDGVIEIQRNELADYFNCVPSQINYVIDTRFTSEKGYYVESRRGGGGHIKIRRINFSEPSSYLMHVINSLGDSITQQMAEIFIVNLIDYDIISKREALLMKAATNDKVLGNITRTNRDKVRAAILKSMLISLII
ncbi:MAG: CtsR family transcriptional regulator [Clostridiaceae bacterium]|jgi:transcriptional regulator CtsR|nr:CtsR family transcriptional regulator [Clostridiaceae bacterium]